MLYRDDGIVEAACQLNRSIKDIGIREQQEQLAMIDVRASPVCRFNYRYRLHTLIDCLLFITHDLCESPRRTRHFSSAQFPLKTSHYANARRRSVFLPTMEYSHLLCLDSALLIRSNRLRL